MSDKWKHILLDAAIVIAIIACVLAAFSMMAEAQRAKEAIEWSRRVTDPFEMSYFTRTPTFATTQSDAPIIDSDGECQFEDEQIECALIEQRYYRDDIPLSYELQDYLQAACCEFGVRYELALAVIERETDFTATVGDGGESIGYFQIQPRWWGALMEEIGVDDLTDQPQNFRLGCAILARLTELYGNETDALTAYNTGCPGRSEYAASVLEMADRWSDG